MVKSAKTVKKKRTKSPDSDAYTDTSQGRTGWLVVKERTAKKNSTNCKSGPARSALWRERLTKKSQNDQNAHKQKAQERRKKFQENQKKVAADVRDSAAKCAVEIAELKN
jgi:hypothetical protein